MTTKAVLGAALVGALAVATVALDQSAAGPNEAAPAVRQPDDAGDPAGVSTSPTGCKACHSGKDAPGNRDFVNTYKSHTFIRMDESVIWETKDPHSRAYAVLLPELDKKPNEVLQRMEAALSARTPGYKAVNDVACLACHSTDRRPDDPGPKTPAHYTRDTQGALLGITCQGCHGVKKEWQEQHDDTQGNTIPWRTKPPEEKAVAGLRNLRDPMVKAILCASCHVGNPKEGKVVTHEMYAAGHPPLPPFELVSFMQDEPRHWGYPHELPFFKTFAEDAKNDTWKTFRYYPEEKEVYLARHAAAGAIAALRAEMALLQAEAETAKKGGLMDFARFDCYACHHDLKYPSARQDRGYAGVPGRPTIKAWVEALPGVVAGHAATLNKPDGLSAEAAKFGAGWADVQKAVLARPFGDPNQLATKAADMTKWCDAFAGKLDDGPAYDRAAANRLLAAIGAAATGDRWKGDAEAVMHLTWAYRALATDGSRLDPLGKFLPLSVRDATMPRPTGERPAVAGEFFPRRQRALRDFQPDEFRAAFEQIVGKK